MSVGSQSDILSRLQQLIPASWFGKSNSFLTAVLWGYAGALSFVYSLYAYAKLQTRIATATDGWLDLISADYFGTFLPRHAGQSDASFRAIIQANLTANKGTRPALIAALTNLTGLAPTVFEPTRPADAGAYNNPAILAYGLVGGYGSLSLPFQSFVTVNVTINMNVPSTAGYNSTVSGYGVGSGEWESASFVASGLQISYQDIYNTISAVIPAGTVCWTKIVTH